MYRLNLLILIILSLETLNAQDYKNFYYEVYLGDKLSHQESYSDALTQYEAASKKVDFVSTLYLQKFLKVAKKAKNETLEKKYESQIGRQKKCPAAYAHVAAKLDSLLYEDQRVRTKKQRLVRYYWKHVDNVAVQNTRKFKKAKAVRMDWKRTDSLNILILLSMFEEHGYLGEDKVGSEKNGIVEMLLLHFDKYTSNVVLEPILDKALVNGQITPHWYALILDRHLYACKLPQKYYAWPMLRSDPGLSKEEITKVVELREEVGMYGSRFKISETRGH